MSDAFVKIDVLNKLEFQESTNCITLTHVIVTSNTILTTIIVTNYGFI